MDDMDDSMIRFCSFEPYEDLSQWGTLNTTTTEIDLISDLTTYLTQTSCYAGQRSLETTLPAGEYLYWGSPQQGNGNGADQLVLSFFYAWNSSTIGTPPSLNIQLGTETSSAGSYTVIGSDPYETITPPSTTPFEWNYCQVLIPLSTLASSITPPYKLWIGFGISEDSNGTMLIDALSLTPLGASGSFHVRRLWVSGHDVPGAQYTQARPNFHD